MAFIRHFFYFVPILFLIAGCNANYHLKKKGIKNSDFVFENVPNDSYARQTFDNRLRNKNNFKIMIAKNIGHTRTESDAIYLPILMNGQSSFSLSMPPEYKPLDTKIDYIKIWGTNTTTPIFTLSQQGNFSWFQANKTYKKIPLFLTLRPTKFVFYAQNNKLYMTINKVKYQVPLDDTPYIIQVGLMRYDLRRYVGRVVPETILHIKNIEIER